MVDWNQQTQCHLHTDDVDKNALRHDIVASGKATLIMCPDISEGSRALKCIEG
jgi:hypothetical protein